MTRGLIHKMTGLAAGLTFATALSLSAAAQTEQPELQASDVTQEELQSFAAATEQVETIGLEWQARIDAAESQEQASQLGAEAQTEMIAAVEAEGLTVEKYNQIFLLAQANPDIQTQVMEYKDAQ